MARGVKLDRADWTLVQYASGAPDSSTKGNIYINSNNGTLYTRRNEEASWSTISGGGTSDHGALTGLSDDDHSQYALLLGRVGGQTLRGGTAAGNDLTLVSTSNATKGYVFLGAETNAYFEDIGKLNITIPDTENSSCAAFTQNDSTNNPNALDITKEGSGYSIFLSSSGSQAQSIWSDKAITIGGSASPDGVNLHSTVTGGTASIEILANSTDSGAEVSLGSLGSGDLATVAISSSGTSNIAPCYVSIDATNAGSDIAYVILGHDNTDEIRFNNTDLNGSTWTQQYAVVSDTSTEWNTYKSNFGEVSIVNAINQAYSAGGASVLDDLSDVSTAGATEDQVLAYNSSSGTWTPATLSGGGGVTLDGAYDYGGAGSGRSIDVDSGAIALTVSDTDNNAALDITQNDTTNNPNALQITKEGTGHSVFLTSAGSQAQSVYSDKSLVVASAAELRLTDSGNSGSSWTQAYTLLSDGSNAEWNTFETNFGEVSIFNALNQAYASGVTLDGAYDYGGAGSGRSIDVDSGAVALTVSDTDNNAALAVTQNDATNDPDAVQITNAGSGYALKITQDGSSTSGIYLTTSGSTPQQIYSDQQLTVGTTSARTAIDGSFGGLILEDLPTTGMSYIEINATSADDTGMISIIADGSTGSQNGIIEIEALGADTSGDNYIKILSDNHAGTDDSFIIIDADGGGTNSVRIGTSTYGSLNEIRFYDVGNDGSTWTQSYVLLTDGSNSEWNNFETNFGEVSIFNALNQLSGAVGGSLALNDLSDVSTGGATQDQVIAYNSSTGTWSPATISGSGSGWTTSENVDVDTGTENVDTFDPDGDGAVLWYYSVQNGANHRAGTVTACWDDSAGTAEYNDVSTSDIGDTSPLSLAVDMTGGSGTVRLRATATTDNWIVKVARAEIL